MATLDTFSKSGLMSRHSVFLYFLNIRVCYYFSVRDTHDAFILWENSYQNLHLWISQGQMTNNVYSWNAMLYMIVLNFSDPL